jgi:predicted TIM-barrel fold metal-dependent hydrolase
MIDTNVTLFQWPFRRLRADDPAVLAEKLQAMGVQQAWASSFEGLLHRDVTAVNSRLAAAARAHPVFLPFGCVNPMLPDWEEDLRRCREEHGMAGVRLFPNYHSYKLDDPAAVRLFQLAAEHRLLVQIPLVMEDERTQHPLLRVPPVEILGLPPLLRDVKGLRVQLLNAFRSVRLEELKRLVPAGEVYFEIAMLEAVGGVSHLLEQAPLERVLFGSHAPLFYFESAQLKLKESALSAEQRTAIVETNARRLLAAARPA